MKTGFPKIPKKYPSYLRSDLPKKSTILLKQKIREFVKNDAPDNKESSFDFVSRIKLPKTRKAKTPSSREVRMFRACRKKYSEMFVEKGVYIKDPIGEQETLPTENASPKNTTASSVKPKKPRKLKTITMKKKSYKKSPKNKTSFIKFN